MSCHVFVVDDDPALGRLASMVLRLEGFEVAAFTSSTIALKEVIDPAAPNPVAIVLDLSMPEMDGREFYQRARHAGFVGPVVIVSAYGAEAAKQELGAEAALSKPFEPDELVAKVSELIGLSHKHQAN